MYYPFRRGSLQVPARAQIQVEAFNYNVNWLGVSELLSSWDLNNTTAFSLKLPITAPNSTFLLCLSWEDEAGDTVRFKLWDGGVLYYPIYNGERIQPDGRLEVWSIGPLTAALDETFTLYSSQLTEPDLCVCTPNNANPLIIPVTAPSGGSPDDPIIVQSVWTAIQGIVALRQISGMVNNQVAYLEFNSTPLDGNGGMYVYDTAETAADDNIDHIKPNSVSVSDPGRWVRQNNP